MKIRKLLINIFLFSVCQVFPVQAKHANTYKHTEATAQTDNKDVYWINSTTGVTYTINENTSEVVKIALDMFSNDMKAVTGQKAKEKANSIIQIFQLNTLTDKEFAYLQKLNLPINRIITKKDAFYIGVKTGKVIILGSNARGTAYGILELSKMAGVSPWIWWNDVAPQAQKYVKIGAKFETTQIPSTEFRAVAINNSDLMKSNQASQLFRLMLRLKANTIWQTESKESHHIANSYKEVADSFDICMGNQNTIVENELKKNKKKIKKHKIKIQDHSTWIWEDKSTWIADTQPGVLYNDYITKGNKESHNVWVFGMTHPKSASYTLSLFMDMAWNSNSVRANSLVAHLENWLKQQFGDQPGKAILPVMKEFYRLTAIRKPEFMNQKFGDMEFASGEFGNELERYLLMFDQLKNKVSSIEKSIPKNQNDAYFEIVKYPIFAASYVAEKELEAQEARYICRPGLFDKDNEAKMAAAISMNAYKKLYELTAYYGKLSQNKWKKWINAHPEVFKAPSLPGNITDKEIEQYKNSADDRQNLQPLNILNANFEARNADKYASVYGTGILNVPLLGHSNNAISLLKATSLNYKFWTAQNGDIRFTLATIPVDAFAKSDMRVSVTIDKREPVICTLKEAYGSPDWQISKNRGQTLRSFYVTLSKGYHNIKIRALDDQIAIDQLMLDYDVDREYYMIPTYGVIE